MPDSLQATSLPETDTPVLERTNTPTPLSVPGEFPKVEQTRGPFDPGGQPDTRIGQPLELGFFAWNIKGGMTASKAVLSDPDRLQNFFEWQHSRPCGIYRRCRSLQEFPIEEKV